jgi:hypothetical protein
MTHESTKNPAASIRVRLLALAQSRSQDYQRILGRYAIERFLYRLGRSTYRDKFAIKGAALFTLWTTDCTQEATQPLSKRLALSSVLFFCRAFTLHWRSNQPPAAGLQAYAGTKLSPDEQSNMVDFSRHRQDNSVTFLILLKIKRHVMRILLGWTFPQFGMHRQNETLPIAQEPLVNGFYRFC